MSEISIDIANFHRYMVEKWNIYLQTKESNRCAICGDPSIEDKDYEYPYGEDSRGCCKSCYTNAFVGAEAPTIEEVAGFKRSSGRDY